LIEDLFVASVAVAYAHVGPSGCSPQRRLDKSSIEDPVGHDLVTLDDAMIVGTVIDLRVVQGVNVAPRQHVALRPVVGCIGI
jgi:hypothetical protein